MMPSPRVMSIIVVLHLLIALGLCSVLSINADEACTLMTTSCGPTFAFQRALSYELQPPLYFVTLSIWRYLGDSLFVARLFSVLCTTATLFMMRSASRRYLPNIPAVWIVMLTACSPFVIYTATEARCYSLVLLISATLLVLFHEAFLSPHDTAAPTGKRRRSQVAYFVMSCVALFTFYPLGLLLAAGGITLTLLRRWRGVRDYAVVMAFTATCFAPLALQVPSQITTHTSDNVVPPSLLASARLVFWHARNVLLPTNWPLADRVAPMMWLAAGVCLAWGLRRLVRHAGDTASQWLWTATTLALFVPFVIVTGTSVFAERHLAPLVLPLLLSSLGVAYTVGKLRGVRIAAGAMLLFMASGLYERNHLWAKPGDWANAAQFLMRYEQPGQPIVVFRPSAALSLGHHYRGVNPILPLPIAPTFEHYDVTRFVITDASILETAIQAADPTVERFWLVTERNPELWTGELGDFGYSRLMDFISTRYTVERDDSLLGSRVRLLRRHPSGTKEKP